MITDFSNYIKSYNLKNSKSIFKPDKNKIESINNHIEDYINYLIKKLFENSLQSNTHINDYVLGIISIEKHIRRNVIKDYRIIFYKTMIENNFKIFTYKYNLLNEKLPVNEIPFFEIIHHLINSYDEVANNYLLKNVHDVFGRYWMGIRKQTINSLNEFRSYMGNQV